MDKRSITALIIAFGVIVIVLILWLVPAVAEDYIEEEPCMVEKTVIITEPYTTTETVYESEPYDTTETYTDSEPYTYKADIPYTRVSYECHSWGWLSDGCDCNVTIRNNDSSHGGRFYATFDIMVRGGATTTVSASEYIGPGQTVTITAKYSGADIDDYWSPDITAPTKDVIGTRNVQKTRTVVKYHDVPKTVEVVKYRDVEKTEEVMDICEVEKTKNVSIFEHLFD